MANKKSAMGSKSPSDSSTFGTLFLRSAVGAGISFLISLLLSILSALVCSRLSDPLSATAAVGSAISFLCYLLAGILSARKSDGSALLSGIGSAALFSLLLLFLGWLTSDGFPSPFGWFLMLLGVAFSVMGAYMTKSRKASKHRPRRHSHGR